MIARRHRLTSLHDPAGTVPRRRMAALGLLLWLFPATHTQAQPESSDPLHRVTLRGIDSLYNLKFAGADEAFDEATRLAPSDPRGWFFKSMVHFYIYQLTEDRKAYDRFFELSETVIEKAEEIVDRDPSNLTARFYLGGIYGYRGLAFQRNGSLLSALWNGRKGYGHLRTAATGEVYSIDAKMGFGLFTYLVAKIPRSYSWVLNILGFSGNLEEGLSMIRAAADSGVYARTEAAFYYAQFCFFERRYEQAYAYMERIISEYPDNSLFLVTFAAWELRQDRVDRAIDIANQAREVNIRNNMSIGDEFAYSTLAAGYYARNEFPEAVRHWERYITLTGNESTVSNFAYFRLGIAYEILGNRPLAVDTWRRMKRSTDKDRPWESVQWRRVQPYLSRALTQSDVLVVVGRNLAQVGKRREAIQHLELAILAAGNDREAAALASYEKLSVLADCDDYEEVVSLAPQILRLNPKTELWVIPHTLYRLGHSFRKLGKNAEALQALTQALAYDNYDWEVNLRERIQIALDALPPRN